MSILWRLLKTCINYHHFRPYSFWPPAGCYCGKLQTTRKTWAVCQLMKELQKRSFAQSYENDTKRILSFVLQQAFKIHLCSFAMTYYNDIDQLQELSLFFTFLTIFTIRTLSITLIETLDVIIFDIRTDSNISINFQQFKTLYR